MSFSAILTSVGQAKAAASATGGAAIALGNVALGDGNGAAVTVNDGVTALVNERWRGAAIASVEPHPQNPNVRVIRVLIDPTVGGFTIREVGIFDGDPALLIYASFPAVDKPDPASGTAFALDLYLEVQITNGEAVTITVVTSGYATTQYVDQQIATLSVPFATVPEHLAGTIDNKAGHPLGIKAVIDAHAATRNHPNSTEGAIGMTRYATQSEIADGAAVNAALRPGPARTAYDGRYVRKAGDVMDAGKNLDFRNGGVPRVLVGTVYRSVWHPGNQGHNSGMDADMVDGFHGADLVPITRQVNTGWGLSGGGSLSANRTLAADQAALDARYLGRRIHAAWNPMQGGVNCSYANGYITFTTPAPGTDYILIAQSVTQWEEEVYQGGEPVTYETRTFHANLYAHNRVVLGCEVWIQGIGIPTLLIGSSQYVPQMGDPGRPIANTAVAVNNFIVVIP